MKTCFNQTDVRQKSLWFHTRPLNPGKYSENIRNVRHLPQFCGQSYLPTSISDSQSNRSSTDRLMGRPLTVRRSLTVLLYMVNMYWVIIRFFMMESDIFLFSTDGRFWMHVLVSGIIKP